MTISYKGANVMPRDEIHLLDYWCTRTGIPLEPA